MSSKHRLFRLGASMDAHPLIRLVRQLSDASYSSNTAAFKLQTQAHPVDDLPL